MKFRPIIRTNAPETLAGLQAGQWIDYEGTRGRYMGHNGRTVWIAWSGAARKRFPQFAAAYRASIRANKGA